MNKLLIIFAILLATSSFVMAGEIAPVYRVKQGKSLAGQECNEQGTVITGSVGFVPITELIQFKVVRKFTTTTNSATSTHYVIQVIPFSNNVPLNQKFVYQTMTVTENWIFKRDVVTTTGEKFFLLSEAEFNENAEPLTDDLKNSGFIVGVLNSPIKVRFGDGEDRNFDFTSNVNLGVTFGHKWKLREKTFLGLLVGVSVSSIPMTTETNKNVTEDTNVAALTFPVSLVYFKNDFQIALSGGYDAVAGAVGKGWVYRDSPWVGIGVGFSVFQISSTKAKEVKEQ